MAAICPDWLTEAQNGPILRSPGFANPLFNSSGFQEQVTFVTKVGPLEVKCKFALRDMLIAARSSCNRGRMLCHLGQFIDHDITFDPASSLQQKNDPDALVNFRLVGGNISAEGIYRVYNGTFDLKYYEDTIGADLDTLHGSRSAVRFPCNGFS